MSKLDDLIDLFYTKPRERASVPKAQLVLEKLLQRTGGPEGTPSDILRAHEASVSDEEFARRFPGEVTGMEQRQAPLPAAAGFDVSKITSPDEARLALEALPLEPNQKVRFIQQVEQLRGKQSVEKVLGPISEITGIDKERLSSDPDSMQALLSTANAFGKVTIDMLDEEGVPTKYLLNTATGEHKRLGKDVMVQGQGQIVPSLTFNEKGQVQGIDFMPAGAVTAESVGARQRLNLAAGREGEFRKQATDTAKTLTGIHQLAKDAQTNTLTGTIAKAAQQVDSFVSQVGDVLGGDVIRSASSVAGRYIDQMSADNPIKQAAVRNAQFRSSLINTAIMMARAQDPGSDRISNLLIENAIATLASDNPGSRAQLSASLQRAGKGLISNLRVQGKEFKMDSDQVLQGLMEPEDYDYFFGGVLRPPSEGAPQGAAEEEPGSDVLVIDAEGNIISGELD
jgi:hypothetical protein